MSQHSENSHRVYIMDKDADYAGRLAASLQRARPQDLFCSFASSPEQALRMLQTEAIPQLIILADDFPLSSQLKKELSSCVVLKKSKRRRPLQKGVIVAGMRLKDILQHIDRTLKRAAPGGISAKPVTFVYSFEARLRYQWLRNFIRQQRNLGRPLYYFPFLPSYQVSLPLKLKAGPELSSILLLLSTGARCEHDGLAHCFELQKEAYYALRCGGRSEDLVTAGIETQKSVLALFRKFIRSRPEPSVGVVEISHIFLRELKILLSFADILVAEIPRGKSYAAQTAREEMNLLLNALPSSVHFQELDPYQIKLPRRQA